MYVSPAEVLLVPEGVVTVTSTEPSDERGVVAVICASESTVKSGAGMSPKETPVAPVKSEPVMVTTLPPAVVPAHGVTLDTNGPRTICASMPLVSVSRCTVTTSACVGDGRIRNHSAA